MTNTIDFKYHQGPYAPDWFDSCDPYHYDITSGTSPFNEWYAFGHDDDVYKLAHSFTSQTFIDEFVFLEDKKAWYYSNDMTLADARAMLEAESRF
tara:strand:- start:248 stop:532 length:285 start_codon:yes stop_codon:yes gene_type:complete